MLFRFNEKSKFLIRNLLRGFLWLAIIIIGFLILKNQFDIDVHALLNPLYDKKLIIYLIFLFSEVVFGIVPPEFFFIWALSSDTFLNYYLIILSLSAISYAAGIIGYFFGAFLHSTRIIRFVKRKYLRKYDNTFEQFGLYLIIVAALTPLPFSAICMLVGTANYSFKKFALTATTRFARFLVYAIFIWEANIL